MAFYAARDLFANENTQETVAMNLAEYGSLDATALAEAIRRKNLSAAEAQNVRAMSLLRSTRASVR